MKVIWKGSIAFGLVNIPINIYSAISSHALGFTLLHETCHTPLKYHRWCPHCKKEVVWQETAKGIKKSDGSYLVLSQEDIAALRPEKTEEIQIAEFVDADKVSVIYFDQHYYVTPNKTGETAYALFTKALEKLGKVAIGRFVMRDKEYTCMLQPYQDYLLLTTLHYAYEVRGVEKLAFTKKVKVNPTELKLAEQFINKLAVKTFDITRFKDTFAQEIKKLLKQRTKKGTTKAKIIKPRKKPTLSEALRASIEQPRTRAVAYAKKR